MMKNKLKEYIEPQMEVMAIAYHAVLMESLIIDDGDPITPAKSPGFDFIEEEEDFLQWEDQSDLLQEI